MSYLSQLFALMWLQFVSAATGIAALAALARGLAGRKDLGNFFVDLQRATFLVLLPLALIVAIAAAAGRHADDARRLGQGGHAGRRRADDRRGPVAAFVAIKQLGTNGGGFFGPNSTHPFENPTFWTNVVSTMCIIVIPMACVWMFGRIVAPHAPRGGGVRRDAGDAAGHRSAARSGSRRPRRRPSPSLPVEQSRRNLEGKELRFGADGRSGLGGDDDRDQQRLGRRDARQPESADRPDADDRHVAERAFSAASASA